MLSIREITNSNDPALDSIVSIHLESFPGFFLSFLGKRFLYHMYSAYCSHKSSALLVAEDSGIPVGFLSFSWNYSNLFKHMLRTRFVPFCWCALFAFFRKPTYFFRLLRALKKSSDVKRTEAYVELSSIGVKPNNMGQGIGSKLIEELIGRVDFDKFRYISLETDAVNNDAVIHFYEKNGFIKARYFTTEEGREMIEYRFPRE